MIVVIDGQQKTVRGRVAGIIIALVEEAELVNREDATVHVEFNCKGRTIKPVINLFVDEVKVVD